MTTALVTVNGNSSDLITFDDSKVELIKRTVAKGATDDELELFLYQAKRMGLDPLARQIHFQKFTSKNGKSNVSFITTIDGYRLVADRTGRYAGNDEPVFEGRIRIIDKGNYDHIDHAPAKATVTVYKLVGGHIRKFSASAYWEEYYPRGNKGHMWRKMPHGQLAKCAEALALRKAFPADLSNVYTNDEMSQADGFELTQEVVEIIDEAPRPARPASNGATPKPATDDDKLADVVINGTAPQVVPNGSEPPRNLADYAKWYYINCNEGSYFESNFHVVGSLKKLFGDDIGITFATRDVNEYTEKLGKHASEQVDLAEFEAI